MSRRSEAPPTGPPPWCYRASRARRCRAWLHAAARRRAGRRLPVRPERRADADQVRELTAALHDGATPAVLVTSDEEGGDVTRLDVGTGSPWPGHAALGALDDVDATAPGRRGARRRARALGVDVVLAPVVDVSSDPDNPVIGERSFGADPELVSRHGAAFVRGLQSGRRGRLRQALPGARRDPRRLPPRAAGDRRGRGDVRARDLAPFAAAVEAGVRCVMTAHVVVRCLDDRPGDHERHR